MINIAILGYGQVSKIFIEKIKKNLDVNIEFILTKNLHKEKLPFIQDHNLILNSNIDVIIEAITDVELAKKILIESKVKYYITCNKPLIYSIRNKINFNKTVYLSSIVCGIKNNNQFTIPLTDKNIFNYSDSDLFCFRSGGALEAAEDMYKDFLIIKKILNSEEG